MSAESFLEEFVHVAQDGSLSSQRDLEDSATHS
ncbi:MAG: hypothetical protein ACI9OJ_000948 [Myxococcota bacterium]|jgi:hypothetical protein